MQLTRHQHRVLEVYRWYRLHPPTSQFYLSAMIWRSAGWVCAGVFAVALLILLISRSAAIGGWIYVLIGVIIGMVIRGMLYYRQTIRIWPVLIAIINWDTVEALLQEQVPERADSHDHA